MHVPQSSRYVFSVNTRIDADTLKLAHGHITRDIIGAFYDVYNGLGHGFLESVYANALPLALGARGVQYVREVQLPVRYGTTLVGEFRADLIVQASVVVEIKAAERIIAAHEAQLLNYIRASGLTAGLLLNFGPRAQFRRLMWTGARAETDELLTTDTN